MANAADRDQVRGMGRIERRRHRRFLEAVAAVMRTPEGRLVFGDRRVGLLARCRVYGSIWHPSAQIHYNAGRQDVGHELMALLIEASEDGYLTMESEMRLLDRRDQNEVQAVQTPATGEGDD